MNPDTCTGYPDTMGRWAWPLVTFESTDLSNENFNVQFGGAEALVLEIDGTALVDAFINSTQCIERGAGRPVALLLDEDAFAALSPSYLTIRTMPLSE